MRRVDQTGLKTGQALTILLLLLAFVLNNLALVALVSIAQLLGALNVPFAPYRLFYVYVARRFVKPNVIEDNPEPHRFAMLVGAVVNALAVGALALDAQTVGWALVWVVIVLANLNFWLNFCAGCWMYYQFHRLGLPGFTQAPVTEQA